MIVLRAPKVVGAEMMGGEEERVLQRELVWVERQFVEDEVDVVEAEGSVL